MPSTETEFNFSELETQLKALLESRDYVPLMNLLRDIPLQDRSRVISRLDHDFQQAVLEQLEPSEAAEFLHLLPEVQAVELLEDITPHEAADILVELPRDEQADFVGDLPDETAEAILHEMDDQAAAQLVRLTSYDDEVAGGLMIAEYLSFSEDQTVDDVLQHLRQNAARYSDFDVQYAYVLNASAKLTGVLRMRDLLLTAPDRKLSTLMIRDPHYFNHLDPLDKLHDFFEEHAFVGVPVVDDEASLVGVVRRGDVEEALGDQIADDYLKSQGIISEELRTMPMMTRARRRLAWLSVNIGLNILAASVIAFYQDTLTEVIALAVFLPIISDMSGCSGNQAVAVSMRELSLGLVDVKELMWVWLKEVSVGLINGLALGLLIAMVAILWKGNPWLGLVVGVAMMVNTVVAVSLGGTLPLIMRRFNLDPALASGPILTTVTDMCGFLLVLSLATSLLDRLV